MREEKGKEMKGGKEGGGGRGKRKDHNHNACRMKEKGQINASKVILITAKITHNN